MFAQLICPVLGSKLNEHKESNSSSFFMDSGDNKLSSDVHSWFLHKFAF
jgi:hypothetical protein